MKLVKRINLLLLCVILLLSVTACNNNTEQVKSSSQDTKINLQSFSQASKTNTKQAESQGNEDKGKMVAKSTFNFTDQCKDMQELYDKAEIVVIGTVISSTPAPMGNAAFTNYELNELKVLKNSINFDESNIVPSMTGGEVNGKTYQSKEIKLVNVGDTYLFFLTRTFPPDRYPNSDKSNLFTPLGAFQGIIKLEKENLSDSLASSDSYSNDLNNMLRNYKVAPFNDNNLLEKSITGKRLSEIAEIK